MYHLQDPLFQVVFNQLVEPQLIIKADGPNYTVVTGNSAWQALAGTSNAALSGRHFWQVSQHLITGHQSAELMAKRMEDAIAQREAIRLPAYADAEHAEEVSDKVWRQIAFMPIQDPTTDQITYLICTVYDVSNEVLDRQALNVAQRHETELLEEQQALNEELAAANEELSAINEDLEQSQENLSRLNHELEKRIEDRTKALAESEQKARIIVTDAPVAIGLLHGRELLIESANSKLLQLWGKTGAVIGTLLHQALPEIKNQPFLSILDDVFISGKSFYGNEIKAVLEFEGRLKDVYINFVYQPVPDEMGNTVSIMVVATDVTEQVNARKQVEKGALQLERMVMNTPVGMAILKGRELSIAIANAPMLEIWNRSAGQVIGKKLMEAFPELEDQPYPAMLGNIFNTREKVAIPELSLYMVLADGQEKQLYVNFSYDPLFDLDGTVEAILVTATDVTALTTGQQLLQQRQEELEALNEEFTAANEELQVTNEELFETQQSLEEIVIRLAESEMKLSSMFNQAPVGICFLSGKDLVIDLANDTILQIWGRSREDVIGLPHQVARPELQGQPVYQWLDEVFKTGITRTNNEFKVHLYDNGSLREAYVNSIYQPLTDSHGQVTGVLVLLNEITDRVLASQQTERAQEQLQQAIDSAQLGTWYMDIATREFIASDRMKELWSYGSEHRMTYEDALNGIADEYRDAVALAIESAIANGGHYELEYAVRGLQDGELKWIKATGTAYAARSGQPPYFSGTLLDITDRKREEIRKNDFIAIASHELKTPLTSLKAYMQVMMAKAKALERSNFFLEATAKSMTQIQKMHTLIQGFLDTARTESGALQLNYSTFLINDLIQEASEDAKLLSDTHTISIRPCNPVTVEADKEKIAQVLTNLLSNALKYSPKGRGIELYCEQVGNEVMISVRDEGMGIKPEDKARLFDRFYRVESKHTRTISGFGIGLYLCAEIIRLHNGRIWVESEPEKGSTFFFSLPLAVNSNLPI